jgi:ParB/RepB/Spo0J family partition protein
MKPVVKTILRKTAAPKASELKVIDIPVEHLIPDEDNPNVMDETTFDMLLEEIREQGFDEPIHVRIAPGKPGYYEVGSGHHRLKAAMVLGMQTVPAVVKTWTDRQKKVALTKRNVLRGKMDKTKLLKLYNDLAKGHDATQVQKELGFSDAKQLDVLIASAKEGMTPKQKQKLDEAKENIKTLDDLSSVLNRIFKESGSEMEKGYLVFSYGGKSQHYVQIDDPTDKKLKNMKAACEDAGVDFVTFLQSIVAEAPLPTGKKTVTKKVLTKPKVS